MVDKDTTGRVVTIHMDKNEIAQRAYFIYISPIDVPEADKRFNLANLRLVNALVPKPKDLAEMEYMNFDVAFVQVDLSGITQNPPQKDKFYYWNLYRLDFRLFALLHWGLAEREFIYDKACEFVEL